MPNHVHLVAQFGSRDGMENCVQAWKASTAHAINAAVGRTGELWPADYWDRAIRNERHYEETIRYGKLNPVKARLVKSVAKWKWLWLAEWLK
jgi:REP element-mobilizing transposase RayT